MSFKFPPRPEKAIAPELISFYEKKGWWAQLKKNGTLQVITISPSGTVTFKTRHNEDNKAWKPTKEMIDHFSRDKDTVLVGELLHSKHSSVKNTLYLFDVLRLHGKDLTGMALKDRVDLLHDTIPGLIANGSRVDHAYWHKKELTGLYHSLHDPLDEGLVLKDPNSKLAAPFKANSNAGWQVKVRKVHKNYGF